MDELSDLLDRAIACTESGQDETAIALYRQLLERIPHLAVAHFNLGLIYKRRGEWESSFYHNQMATQFNPEDESAWWNLGIAATVLEEWKTARDAWNHFGLDYLLSDTDPAGNLGSTPIRINPHDQAEVVWAIRLDPCRAMLYNIPLPESNHRYHDIVLNDGVPNGYRNVQGKEYAVFDELGLLTHSDYQTYSVRCPAIPEEVFEDLEMRCESEDIGVENWSTQIRMICRQCSEGHPHDTHDHELEEAHSLDSFLIGLAARSQEHLSQVLRGWSTTHGLELTDYAFYPLEEDAEALLSGDSSLQHDQRISTRFQRKKKMLQWLQDKQN
jgi:hypothetical protein